MLVAYLAGGSARSPLSKVEEYFSLEAETFCWIDVSDIVMILG
jgi:hypothetical protein